MRGSCVGIYQMKKRFCNIISFSSVLPYRREDVVFKHSTGNNRFADIAVFDGVWLAQNYKPLRLPIIASDEGVPVVRAM